MVTSETSFKALCLVDFVLDAVRSSQIHFRHDHAGVRKDNKGERHRPSTTLVSGARLVLGGFSALSSSSNLPVMYRKNPTRRRLNNAKPPRLAQRRLSLVLESRGSPALTPHSVSHLRAWARRKDDFSFAEFPLVPVWRGESSSFRGCLH